MLHNVYAVKDELQGEFMQPIYSENDTLAIRQFKYQINNIDQWKYNSTDYSLYKLGTFDTASGEYFSYVEKVCTGRSVLDNA